MWGSGWIQGSGIRGRGVQCGVSPPPLAWPSPGFRVQGSDLEFRVGLGVEGLGCSVRSSGGRVHVKSWVGLGFRVQGSGFRVQGSEFRVQI